MPNLPRVSGKDAIKAFGKVGYVQVRVSGRSHALLKREGVRKSLSVPLHKELKTGLLGKLIKAANMTVEEFCKLL